MVFSCSGIPRREELRSTFVVERALASYANGPTREVRRVRVLYTAYRSQPYVSSVGELMVV